MKPATLLLTAVLALTACSAKIDRPALVARNNPHVTALDPSHRSRSGTAASPSRRT